MGHYKAVRLRIKELKQDNGKLRHCICLYHKLSKRDDEEIMFWRGRARELESKLQKLQNTKSAETKKLYLVIDRNWDEVLEKYSCPVILEEEKGDDGVYTVIKDERDGKYLDYIRGNVCQYVVKCVEYEAKVR